jgi:hypothetical protein
MQQELSFVLPFHCVSNLSYGITLFVKFEGPQGLPKTNVSHRSMFVDIATEQALVSECRCFLAPAIAINAVQNPGDFPRRPICLFYALIRKERWVQGRPSFTSAQGFVPGNFLRRSPIDYSRRQKTDNNDGHQFTAEWHLFTSSLDNPSISHYSTTMLSFFLFLYSIG